MANRADAADTTANEALALASTSDTNGNTLISRSAQLQANAAQSAPGNADMVLAESAVYELYSKAVQHKLLAAQLRACAQVLASRAAATKEATTSHAVIVSGRSQ